ncbi:gastric inhibitory polypeptide receptor [Larimichthys crocea]|uniref:gastric inhibitory polypeptide receptor n=1 Tax=Larimichthys crocea TaxID=215358 RepID=UPI000F604282|nr:gastric inhibitory polypeptide receptor-like [Larimichthys crocea]
MKTSDTFLIFLLLYRTLCVSGGTVTDTVAEWNRYRNECLISMSTDPRPEGATCSRMFDMYACWSDGKPNSTVKVPCPWYLPWYNQVRDGFVLRECGPDGQWATSNSSRTWRDHSQCDRDNSMHIAQERRMVILAHFRVMYTVGYCLSLASLSLALVILLFFRKLHCTRNYIHINLFASFILRAASILTRDALLSRDTEFKHDRNISDVGQAMSGCHVAQVLMQYCVGANYYWLLVEGLYLHKLLVLAVFSENRHFYVYLLIGWGTPVLFVIPWIIVRYLFENTRCWEINENKGHWWIIRAPILLAILVNFFIFIRIIHILVSKLKAHQMRYTDYKFRLAKSTLTLIPLLGIHEVVFAVLTEEPTDGVLNDVSLFFELFLNSFQGLLVAILYCFVNKEVQAEIKKKWQRWKLGMTDLEDLRNTGSNTPQVGTSMPLPIQCQHPSPRLPPAHRLENNCLSAPPPDPSGPLHTKLLVPQPCTHQDQLEATQPKTYCCISALRQDDGGGNEKSGESYC